MDATDVAILFTFIIFVLAISFVSALRTVYRAAYWAGKRHGRLEARIEEKIEKVFESPEWERELDC